MGTLVTFITFRANELAFRFDELAIKLATQVARFLSAIKKAACCQQTAPSKGRTNEKLIHAELALKSPPMIAVHERATLKSEI